MRVEVCRCLCVSLCGVIIPTASAERFRGDCFQLCRPVLILQAEFEGQPEATDLNFAELHRHKLQRLSYSVRALHRKMAVQTEQFRRRVLGSYICCVSSPTAHQTVVSVMLEHQRERQPGCLSCFGISCD